MELRTDILDPAVLTATTRGELEAEQENDITQLLLPNETSPDIRVEFHKRAAQQSEGTPLRAWDAESAIGGRARGAKRQAETTPASWKVRLSEYERLRRLNQTDEDSVLAATEDRRTEVREVITNRLRRLRSEALLTGQLQINEEGVIIEVDFDRHPDFTTTAPNQWSDEAADPLADYEGWVEAYAEENGIEPTLGVIGRRGASALLRNPNTIARFPQGAQVTLGAVNGLVDEMGLPPLRVNRDRRVLSQEHLVLATPGADALGSTVWGPTAEAQELDYGLEDHELPGMAVGIYAAVDPVVYWVHGAANYLPLLKNANLSFSAQILSGN